jgi:GxxExxY protein
LSTPDTDDLTHRIIGLAMRVHTRLGPGLLESAYERCLCHEFDQNALAYARQVDLPLNYDGVLLDCGYRADLIVDDEVIL